MIAGLASAERCLALKGERSDLSSRDEAGLRADGASARVDFEMRRHGREKLGLVDPPVQPDPRALRMNVIVNLPPRECVEVHLRNDPWKAAAAQLPPVERRQFLPDYFVAARWKPGAVDQRRLRREGQLGSQPRPRLPVGGHKPENAHVAHAHMAPFVRAASA